MKTSYFGLAVALVLAAPGPTPFAAAAESRPPARIVYKPPLRGAPQVRVGAGTRGIEGQALPLIEALAPNHVGLTQSRQPTLYWFISQPTSVKAELTLIDAAGERPLLEIPIDNPAGPAIHAVDLARYGVSLEPGVDYSWTIALVPSAEARSRDIVSTGAIRYLPPTAAGGPDRAPPASERAVGDAEQGMWYDALDTLSKAIAADAGDAASRTLRADLLEQAGLPASARFDRAASTTTP